MKATVFHEGRHLDEAEMTNMVERCPICLRTGPRTAVLQLQRSPSVELLRCEECKGCSASRMPTRAVLDRFYAEYYAGKSQKNTCPLPEKFARHIARHLDSSALPEVARILDYGGGDGALSVAIGGRLLRGGRVARTEIDVVDYQEPGKSPDPRIVIARHRGLETMIGGYDVVIASAVLEHLPDIHPVMERLFRLARRPGYFYARTPHMVPFARIFRGMDMTYPAHVHDLGGSFWNRIRETFELKADVLVSGPSPIESDPRLHPARSTAAWISKLPARIEGKLRGPSTKDPIWNWVGGWEILLRF